MPAGTSGDCLGSFIFGRAWRNRRSSACIPTSRRPAPTTASLRALRNCHNADDRSLDRTGHRFGEKGGKTASCNLDSHRIFKMIPLRDVIPSRTTPYVTVAIILLNVVAWCYELFLPDRVLPAFLQIYGVVPADFEVSRVSTLLTSMFLHAGWMQVVSNMWCLWIFGDNVEDRIGHGGFIVFYLLCGIVAALGQTVIDSGSTRPIVGASGAVAGVLGAYFALYPRSRVLTLIPLVIYWDIIEAPALLLLGLWFLMHLFSVGTASASGGIDGAALMAYVASFVTGIGGILAFQRRPREPYWP